MVFRKEPTRAEVAEATSDPYRDWEPELLADLPGLPTVESPPLAPVEHTALRPIPAGTPLAGFSVVEGTPLEDEVFRAVGYHDVGQPKGRSSDRGWIELTRAKPAFNIGSSSLSPKVVKPCCNCVAAYRSTIDSAEPR